MKPESDLLKKAKVLADILQGIPKHWDAVAWLKAKDLWAEGVSAGEIGKAIKVSKSKVLRASRSGNWVRRESPIQPKIEEPEVKKLPNRDFALPAGDPLTWGIISNGMAWPGHTPV